MKAAGETKTFDVVIAVEEDDKQTAATASIDVGGAHFGGWGRARRSPGDPQVRRIGEELAIARALSDLAHNLLDAAAQGIEDFEGKPVQPHL